MAAASATPSSGNVSNYGAVGDGVTNDTAAFNLCLTHNIVCWVDPAKTYAVGNVQMKNGNRLIGLGTVEYGDRTASTASTRPVLVGVAGSSSVLDVSAISNSAAIDGVFIDCKSSSINGISGGSFQLTVQDTTVVGCAAGLGDLAGSTYTTEAHIINVTFGGNQRGISNPIDSFVVNTDLPTTAAMESIWVEAPTPTPSSTAASSGTRVTASRATAARTTTVSRTASSIATTWPESVSTA